MADKDTEALLTEEDRLFCLRLAQECEIKNIEEKPKRRRKKKNKKSD